MPTGTRGHAPSFVLGACVAAGAAYLLPATYNYVVTPIVTTFGVQESESALLRQVPNIASLLVLFVAGVLGRRMGERRVLVAGGALLFAGNAVAAAAPVFPVLIVGLSVQATGSTALLVVSLALLGARIREPAARASAFAAFAMVSPVVFVVLPVAAGALLDAVTWRSVVALWAVGGLVAIAAVLRLVPDDRDAGLPASRGELVTPVLAGVVCTALVQAIANVDVDGTLSAATVIRLGVGVGALVALVIVHRRTEHPSLSITVLRKGGTVLLLVVVALWCMTQLWYYMTLAYEYVYGMDALWAAVTMVPAQTCAIIGARIAGRMVQRTGITVSGTVLLTGVGVSMLLAVPLRVGSPLWAAVAVTCLYSLTAVGAGVPLTNALMDSAPEGDDASASAYRNAAIDVGTVLGIALVSALAYSTFATALGSDLAAAGLATEQAAQIAEDLRDGAASEEESAVYAVPLEQVQAIGRSEQDAFMVAVSGQSWSGAAVSFLSVPVFVWARRRQVRDRTRR